MSNSKIYLSDKHALAFYQQKASPDFWDRHWQIADLRSLIRGTTNDGLFIPAVKRHLPSGSTVLEGGCGRGQLVYALQYSGYKAIGVDFASETIKNIKQAVPELDVRLGDVCALDLPNGSLDGYVSAGVIEHFWEGHFPIIREMYRTLRMGGFLFVSFPYLSPLRRLKVSLHLYPFKESNLLDDQQEQFYQFALTGSKVQADLEVLGFELKEKLTYGGIKGFKDEVALFKPWLQEIYDGKRGYRLRRRLDKLFKSFASHCVLLVMQKVQ